MGLSLSRTFRIANDDGLFEICRVSSLLMKL
jgi:hypothetical protein